MELDRTSSDTLTPACLVTGGLIMLTTLVGFLFFKISFLIAVSGCVAMAILYGIAAFRLLRHS